MTFILKFVGAFLLCLHESNELTCNDVCYITELLGVTNLAR